eukprot:5171825-Prymnesium_polylepis.3
MDALGSRRERVSTTNKQSIGTRVSLSVTAFRGARLRWACNTSCAALQQAGWEAACGPRT